MLICISSSMLCVLVVLLPLQVVLEELKTCSYERHQSISKDAVLLADVVACLHYFDSLSGAATARIGTLSFEESAELASVALEVCTELSSTAAGTAVSICQWMTLPWFA